MNDWQVDPEGWKDGNEELLNEYEAQLQKKMDAELIKKLDAEHEKSMEKFGIKRAKLIKHWILDENHQVVQATYGEWAVWFERVGHGMRHVRDTWWNFAVGRTEKELDLDGKKFTLPKYKYSGIRVSTVFLGLDHSFMSKTPLLFETMIFGGDESEEYQERYSTWKQAEEGHQKAVDMVKKKYNLPDGEEQV